MAEEALHWVERGSAGLEGVAEEGYNAGNAERRDGPEQLQFGTNEGRDGGSSGRERRRWAESEVGETDDAPST